MPRGFRNGNENLREIIASSPFSLPPPAFAFPLAGISRVYFSRYPQMESLLAGYQTVYLRHSGLSRLRMAEKPRTTHDQFLPLPVVSPLS